MNIKSHLNFSVDKVIMDKQNDYRFSGATIYAFADGENANTLPIDTDVLVRCSKTVYDIPIVCKYSEQWGDFLSHEEDEVPIGFVKESSDTYDNPIQFTKNPDGRTFLTIKGLIWKRYSGKALDVLMRGDKKKSVSIEMQVTDGEETKNGLLVKEFVLEAITVLGDFIEPAVKDAKIMMEFSKDKKDYLKMVSNKFAAKKTIKIDNDKDSAVSGSWSNPRRKLFDPINNASNRSALLKEAYLVNEGDKDNPEISKLKYPHHVIRDGKLVLHVDGVQAAFQRAKQQGIFEGDVKSHLERHYRELGLSMENFSCGTVSVSESSDNEMVGETEMALDEQKMSSQECVDCAEEKVECAEAETKVECANGECECKESVECADEEKVECSECIDGVYCEDASAKVNCTQETCEADVQCSDDEHNEDEHEDKHEDPEDDEDKDEHDEDEDEDDDDEEDFSKMSDEKKLACYNALLEKCENLQSANKAYMEKLATMLDYEDLKKFKADTEEKQRREEEMAKMEKVMAEIENCGFSMSDEDKKELMAKCHEFESMDAWSNYVKAQAFDKAAFNEKPLGFALPFAQTKSESIWDRI